MLYRGFKQDMIACLGEFVGTTMFIFLGLGCVKTAQDAQTASQLQTSTSLSNQTIIFISLGMGFSLLVTAWVFYRITGGLFNPAVTLALYLIGGLTAARAVLLTIAQFAGGIAGSALVSGLTAQGPSGGISSAITKLEPGMSKVRGTFLEAFLTALLVFTVLMLAAEKHKATYLAPIGIGLALFVGQLFGTLWTGCGMNPARSLGPSVVAGSFPGYHWIYYVGPFIGSLIATFLYALLKAFDYTSVVLGQDSSDEQSSPKLPPPGKHWHAAMGFTRQQRKAMLASGMHPNEIERTESAMVEHATQAGGAPDSPSQHSDATLLNSPPGQHSTIDMHPADGSPTSHNGTYVKAGRTSNISEKPHHSGSKRHSTAAKHTNGNDTGTNGRPNPELSSMQPGMQNSGSIAAPGAQSGGLTNVPYLKKIFRSPNHNAH